MLEYTIRILTNNKINIKVPLLESKLALSFWLVDIITGEIAEFNSIDEALEELEYYMKSHIKEKQNAS